MVVVPIGVVVVVLDDTVDIAGVVDAVDDVVEDTVDVEVVSVTQAFTLNAESSAYPLPLNSMVIVWTDRMLLITNLPNAAFCMHRKYIVNMVPIY